jgi:hypothetical protein
MNCLYVVLPMPRRLLGMGRPTSAFFPGFTPGVRQKEMKMGLIVLIIIIILLVGAFPTWPHSQSWGYGPSGILGTILVIVLILFLLGRL